MKKGARLAIVVLLALAAAATFALREGKRVEHEVASAPLPAVAPSVAPLPVAVTPGVAPGAAPPARATAPEASAPAPEQDVAATAAPPPSDPVVPAAPRAPAAAARARLLELGSMRCMACLEMAKVLDALRASQGSKLQVDFIDVFEQPEAGDRYRITLIPTQILYDSVGTEIFRHTGYFSHDDVLKKFRELGVKL